MKSFSITDIGLMRSINQDVVYRSEDAVGCLPNLFIVADGMGGHNAGDYASSLCVEKVLESIKSSEKKTIVSVLEEAIQFANQTIYLESLKNKEWDGMGTTLVMAVVVEHTLYVANVGDSRLYLLQDDLQQITEDHSLVEEMVKSGEIQKDEMRLHPSKNIITRALGSSYEVQSDFFEVEVQKGNTILLCSDGLTNMLEDAQIQHIILENKEDIEVATSKLIENANQAGGKDNISTILIYVEE